MLKNHCANHLFDSNINLKFCMAIHYQFYAHHYNTLSMKYVRRDDNYIDSKYALSWSWEVSLSHATTIYSSKSSSKPLRLLDVFQFWFRLNIAFCLKLESASKLWIKSSSNSGKKATVIIIIIIIIILGYYIIIIAIITAHTQTLYSHCQLWLHNTLAMFGSHQCSMMQF